MLTMTDTQIDLDLSAGDVALIIKADGTVAVFLPEEDESGDPDAIASPQVGLISACGYLITQAEHNAECLAMLDRLATMMIERGSDA
jgi:hypothetical protein